MPDADIDQKLERMQSIIRSLERVAVAFSAGVDSTFILKVSLDVLGQDNVIAVTSKSDSLARAELKESHRLADLFGVRHIVVDTDEFQNPDYLANPANRCYFCKTALYDRMTTLIQEHGFKSIVSGTNADDLGDWRPGIQAAREHAVRSPAAEAGMTKQDIRVLSKRMGLPTFDKPAAPCLSSRVQYGEHISPEKLRMIESCEAFLHTLGIRECRVRHHNNLARIEVPVEHFAELTDPKTRKAIDEHFRAVGYNYVALDLRGFRSGSMNEVLGAEQTQRSQ